MNKYTKLFLFGPRLSGKSTLGKLIAERLKWKFVDMDELIMHEAGKSIDEITEKGTNWQAFRNIELAVMTTLLREHNIVVSTGGGLGVNNIIKDGTTNTYGEIETKLLKQSKDVFRVVLLPGKDAFISRVHQDEAVKYTEHRPLLDEKRAEEIEEMTKNIASESTKRDLLIAEKIKSTIASYDQRKKLYEALADIQIDTGKLSIKQAVIEIVDYFSGLT